MNLDAEHYAQGYRYAVEVDGQTVAYTTTLPEANAEAGRNGKVWCLAEVRKNPGDSGSATVGGAAVAKAWGDDGAQLVAILAEMRESDLRSFLSGMLDAVPAWVRLRADVQAGDVAADYDLTRDVLLAAYATRAARDQGVTVDALRRQVDLARPLTPAADLVLLSAHPRGARASSKSLADVLGAYAGSALAQRKAQASMFGTPPPPLDLLRQAYVTVVWSQDESPVEPKTALQHARRIGDAKVLQLWPEPFGAPLVEAQTGRKGQDWKAQLREAAQWATMRSNPAPWRRTPRGAYR